MTQQQVQVPDERFPAIERRIAKAKSALILEHPFIGTIALNMPMTVSRDVPTAATNGKWVKYNPEFVDPLTDEQVKFLVAHECMHPMLEHNYRLHGRDHKKWNKAGDYVINQLLSDEGIGKFIDGGCLDANIYAAGGKTSDGIYNILPEDDGSGGGGAGGNGGGIGQDLVPTPGNGAEVSQAQAEMKVMVAQAAAAAKMAGKLSANMARLVNEILEPKVDWREVLNRFLVRCKDDTRSFARPNRRFLSLGLYMPTVTGESMGEVAFAIDCSGSIGQQTLNQFSAEIMRVKEDLNPTVIHLIYFDSEVSHYEWFGKDDDLHVEMHGGGGTAFSPVMRCLEEKGVEPVALVFLTDLCCHDFGPQPSYPVLWVSTDPGTAPWGEIVLM